MGRSGAGLGISHTRPAPFNFLNGTGMRIIFYKRGRVGMGATRPEPAPLPFLHVIMFFLDQIHLLVFKSIAIEVTSLIYLIWDSGIPFSMTSSN